MNTRPDDPLFEDSRFIEGVYNYCDRWCERCPVAHRCRVFAMEAVAEAEDESGEARNGDSTPLARRLDRLIHDAEQLLENVPSNQLTPSGTTIESNSATRQDGSSAVRHSGDAPTRSVLVADAEAYSDEANAWFLRQSEALLERERELNRLIDLGRESEAEDAGCRIVDAIEAVRWDQWLIPAKLHRAESGLDVATPDDPESARDAEGSAKVALLSLDRSIDSWTVLRDELPHSEDSILPLLLSLSRLRGSVESTFPSARDFRRPGFDE